MKQKWAFLREPSLRVRLFSLEQAHFPRCGWETSGDVHAGLVVRVASIARRVHVARVESTERRFLVALEQLVRGDIGREERFVLFLLLVMGHRLLNLLFFALERRLI